MKRYPLFAGIIALVLAVAIFIFTDGARRIYSGVLFTILGIVMLYRARAGQR